MALAACLSDPDRGVRHAAAGTLSYLGLLREDATAAVPALEAAVGDSDQFVRANAAMAMVNRLEAAFDTPRWCAVAKGGTQMAGSGFTPALSLGMIGPEAKSAVPALRIAVKSKDGLTRATAAWALEDLWSTG